MRTGTSWMATLVAAVTLLGPAVAASATVREYFIAAEEVAWDFAPPGAGLAVGGAHAGGVPRPWIGHTRARKVRYIEYTDATYTVRKAQPEWLGIHHLHGAPALTLRRLGSLLDAEYAENPARIDRYHA